MNKNAKVQVNRNILPKKCLSSDARKMDKQIWHVIKERILSRPSNDPVLHVIEILEALPYKTDIVAASLTNDGVVDEGVWQANIDLAVTKMKKI